MHRVVLLLIRTYQLTFSAMLGRQCRYLPTCSAYAADAVTRYGVYKGGRMALRRILRCHPWRCLGGGSGYDPVP